MVTGMINQISIMRERNGSLFPTEKESDNMIVGSRPINQIGTRMNDITLNIVIIF